MARGRGRPAKNEKQVEEADPESSAAEEEYEVERVESHQITGKGKRAKLQYLVKWKNYPDSDNTWEPAEAVENAKQLVDEYWATQGGEKEREEVFKQLQGGNKAAAATKEKKEVAVAEEEEPVVESRKRKARGTTAASTETATATTTNSRKKRAKADTSDAEDTKQKESEAAYESEDEFDVSDSEVEGETFRINQKWDGRVYKVQYVRRDEDDDQLYAIVRWNDSKLAKYKTSTVARKAPLKLIEFYENRLSFQED
ncbi:hypothetical protein HMPREF1544_04685 [Mucor circinelloides 1006PhL]|uniref:Chromo domain-containing protein n=1 Tax=Mucor circinelloides f. circinelloides (strain 1006PhL) TaxID=1220926 RepID=S2K881_MUCC1|nr:hypothetical protein HMPREF1544_04685 [Mucor circinelloides 1006PhL]